MSRWKDFFAKGNVTLAEKEVTSRRLQVAMDIFAGQEPWRGECHGKSLHLARTAAKEVARVVCAEMEMRVDCGAMQREVDVMLPRFAAAVRGVLGVGEGMFRIYPLRDEEQTRIAVDFLLPGRYEVTKCGAGGQPKAVTFYERFSRGARGYVHAEEHEKQETGGYVIRHKLYEKAGNGRLRELPLTACPETAGLEAVCQLPTLASALFVPWRLLGEDGRVGEPIWAGAQDLMRDADRQYDRLLWEFEGGELAVDVSEDAFRMDRAGNAILPLGKDRLYRMNQLDERDGGGEMMKVFSPALRDESLIRGLDRILMAFEDAVGLARGTVTGSDRVMKTATEVRAGKQRTHLTAVELRRQAREVLLAIYAGMYELGGLCGMHDGMDDGAAVMFGDGVLSTVPEDREADRKDVECGLMSALAYQKKWMLERREDDD